MELLIPPRIPAQIAKQAVSVHHKWKTGQARARKANCDRGYLMLEVGRSYRLLSKHGAPWELMTHEKYNKVFK